MELSLTGVTQCRVPGSFAPGIDGVTILWDHGGRITELTRAECKATGLYNCDGGAVIPFLVDQHLHGVRRDEPRDDVSFGALASRLSAEGVGVFVPSSIAMPLPDLELWLRSTRTAIASDRRVARSVPGVHVEGTLISTDRRGAHDERFVYGPDPDILRRLTFLDAGDVIRRVTVCPHGDLAPALIRHAVSSGIRVALGHTSARYDEAAHAIDAGASCITHAMNCMLPIASREPGLLGAALAAGIYVELIPNPEMVHPVVSQVVGAAVDPDRLILVSDCLASMTFAGATRSRSGLSYTRDGTVLGGALSLGALLPHAKPIVGASLVALVRASSQNALCHLGLPSTWPLEVGMDASFLVIDERWQLQAVVRDGKVLRSRRLK